MADDPSNEEDSWLYGDSNPEPPENGEKIDGSETPTEESKDGNEISEEKSPEAVILLAIFGPENAGICWRPKSRQHKLLKTPAHLLTLILFIRI